MEAAVSLLGLTLNWIGRLLTEYGSVAQEFFPALKEVCLESLNEKMNVRVGLHPCMPDGKPVIGPVPGMPNLFLAAGHEGEGLTAW